MLPERVYTVASHLHELYESHLYRGNVGFASFRKLKVLTGFYIVTIQKKKERKNTRFDSGPGWKVWKTEEMQTTDRRMS